MRVIATDGFARAMLMAAVAATAGCGAAPAGPVTAEAVAAQTAPPPDDCYRVVSIPYIDYFNDRYRNFDWPGGDPWKGDLGFVVSRDNGDGSLSVYGIHRGPADIDNQVIWFDLRATAAEVTALRCLAGTLHCDAVTPFPETGQVGGGVPPGGPGDPVPTGVVICVPKAVFTAIDDSCVATVGPTSTCAPPPPVCVPLVCRPSMNGVFDDGCGSEICCAKGKPHFCE